jgi:hypothetical protein
MPALVYCAFRTWAYHVLLGKGQELKNTLYSSYLDDNTNIEGMKNNHDTLGDLLKKERSFVQGRRTYELLKQSKRCVTALWNRIAGNMQTVKLAWKRLPLNRKVCDQISDLIICCMRKLIKWKNIPLEKLYPDQTGSGTSYQQSSDVKTNPKQDDPQPKVAIKEQQGLNEDRLNHIKPSTTVHPAVEDGNQDTQIQNPQ